MKKLIFAIVLFFVTAELFAQTEGISYQAVIIGPDKQELPGEDANGNILPNAAIAMRFSIIDGTNQVIYQEVQKTHTDQFGRINLLIGSVEHDKFTQLDWDGTAKDLKVEIDFKGGSNFVDMSRENLNFIPYAYHRNVTARGNLIVDGFSDLNGELTVQGPTNLHSTLYVSDSNATTLTGSLTVDGPTNLTESLIVGGIANFNKIRVADSANFDGPVEFKGNTVLSNLSVNGISDLNGQVTINANMDTLGGDDNYKAYPLLVQGSKQGIAIKVNGSRANANNFISFWDTTDGGKMWGRIEGETEQEMKDNNFDYKHERNQYIGDEAFGVIDLGMVAFNVFATSSRTLAATTSTTACVGVGACATIPIPSLIVESVGENIAAIIEAAATTLALGFTAYNQIVFYNDRTNNIGVSYQSGAGDYAEYLMKSKLSETFMPGDIVGIKGGKISKNTTEAEKMMVISKRPIVLGNMPQAKDEKYYEKVAFLGQVPVKVFGKVNLGDYIIPNDNNNGVGKAVSPSEIKSEDIKKIVGIAWSTSPESIRISLINVAVGLNVNDNQKEVEELRSEVNDLKNQIAATNIKLDKLMASLTSNISSINSMDKLTALLPTNASAINSSSIEKITDSLFNTKKEFRSRTLVIPESGKIKNFEIPKEQIKEGLEYAEKYFKDRRGQTSENNPVLKLLHDDPSFRERFINKIYNKYKEDQTDTQLLEARLDQNHK